MNQVIFALLALAFLTGCDASNEDTSASAHALAQDCVTTGPNSPIVAGTNSIVVIDGNSVTPGDSVDCDPTSAHMETHGAGSPIVTGAGAQVIIRTD